MRKLSICGASLGLMTIFLCGVTAQVATPQLHEYVDHFEPTAATLAQRASQVPAVVVGRVEESTIRLAPNAAAGSGDASVYANVPRVYTKHTVAVLDVLKVDQRAAPPGGSMTILQRAGSTNWNGYRVKVEGDDPLPLGGEYVFLLTWRPELDAFEALPFDTLKLLHGTIAVDHGPAYAKAQNGVPLAVLAATVRSAGVR
jgi:hypothetical protein